MVSRAVSKAQNHPAHVKRKCKDTLRNRVLKKKGISIAVIVHSFDRFHPHILDMSESPNFPCVTRIQQFFQASLSLCSLRGINLLSHEILIAGPIERTENADGRRHVR